MKLNVEQLPDRKRRENASDLLQSRERQTHVDVRTRLQPYAKEMEDAIGPECFTSYEEGVKMYQRLITLFPERQLIFPPESKAPALQGLRSQIPDVERRALTENDISRVLTTMSLLNTLDPDALAQTLRVKQQEKIKKDAFQILHSFFEWAQWQPQSSGEDVYTRLQMCYRFSLLFPDQRSRLLTASAWQKVEASLKVMSPDTSTFLMTSSLAAVLFPEHKAELPLSPVINTFTKYVDDNIQEQHFAAASLWGFYLALATAHQAEFQPNKLMLHFAAPQQPAQPLPERSIV